MQNNIGDIIEAFINQTTEDQQPEELPTLVVPPSPTVVYRPLPPPPFIKWLYRQDPTRWIPTASDSDEISSLDYLLPPPGTPNQTTPSTSNRAQQLPSPPGEVEPWYKQLTAGLVRSAASTVHGLLNLAKPLLYLHPNYLIAKGLDTAYSLTTGKELNASALAEQLTGITTARQMTENLRSYIEDMDRTYGSAGWYTAGNIVGEIAQLFLPYAGIVGKAGKALSTAGKVGDFLLEERLPAILGPNLFRAGTAAGLGMFQQYKQDILSPELKDASPVELGGRAIIGGLSNVIGAGSVSSLSQGIPQYIAKNLALDVAAGAIGSTAADVYSIGIHGRNIPPQVLASQALFGGILTGGFGGILHGIEGFRYAKTLKDINKTEVKAGQVARNLEQDLSQQATQSESTTPPQPEQPHTQSPTSSQPSGEEKALLALPPASGEFRTEPATPWQQYQLFGEQQLSLFGVDVESTPLQRVIPPKQEPVVTGYQEGQYQIEFTGKEQPPAQQQLLPLEEVIQKATSKTSQREVTPNVTSEPIAGEQQLSSSEAKVVDTVTLSWNQFSESIRLN